MKPRELTPEEVQERFLKAVWGQIHWWANETRAESTEDRLSGLAHSMLSLIDGSNATIPAFILAPLPHPTDKAYHKSQGENYFPCNKRGKKNGNAIGVKSDIGGNLAYQLYRVKEKMDKESNSK